MISGDIPIKYWPVYKHSTLFNHKRSQNLVHCESWKADCQPFVGRDLLVKGLLQVMLRLAGFHWFQWVVMYYRSSLLKESPSAFSRVKQSSSSSWRTGRHIQKKDCHVNESHRLRLSLFSYLLCGFKCLAVFVVLDYLYNHITHILFWGLFCLTRQLSEREEENKQPGLENEGSSRSSLCVFQVLLLTSILSL